MRTTPQTAINCVKVLKRSDTAARDPDKKRVAAYCRVSTDKDSQSTSLDTQIKSFDRVISARRDWRLAGIYADEGRSGTNACNRAQFKRMIADCESGKIDYIVTKSVSRFARNTIDCLQYVRMLKEIGVYVYFDENHLDTANTSSEMLLSILAAFAQEESHSISQNMKWGIRKRFEAGHPKWVRTYGFRKNDQGAYEIDTEQAKGVRRIFELYCQGWSLPSIAKRLETENIPSMNAGKWWPKSLATILRNEKYVGDVMMQKYYTVDHLTHRKVKNDQTVIPSFYVKGHHEPIIDRETYDMASTILSLKDTHKGCVQYPYYGTLICPICGSLMVSFHLDVYRYPRVWTCGGQNSAESAGRCRRYAIHSKYLDRALKEGFRRLDEARLRRLADSPDTHALPAARALEWKRSFPVMNKIEYIFLSQLVLSITFADWTRIVINWKFGFASSVDVTYDKVSEIPEAALERTQDGFFINGEKVRCGEMVYSRVEATNACCDKIRRQSGRPHSIRGK